VQLRITKPDQLSQILLVELLIWSDFGNVIVGYLLDFIEFLVSSDLICLKTFFVVVDKTWVNAVSLTKLLHTVSKQVPKCIALFVVDVPGKLFVWDNKGRIN
jgi:hypothetical protein